MTVTLVARMYVHIMGYHTMHLYTASISASADSCDWFEELDDGDSCQLLLLLTDAHSLHADPALLLVKRHCAMHVCWLLGRYPDDTTTNAQCRGILVHKTVSTPFYLSSRRS